MAHGEPNVDVVVVKRGKNNKAQGVVFEKKVYKIGEKFSAPRSDANYLIGTGKCALASEAKAAEPKK